MPPSSTLLSVLHLVLLAAFVGMASVSMLTTLLSHLRIRCMLMAWRCGWLRGFPVGPALFTGVVTAGLLYAWSTGQPIRASALVGYPAGGLFWCIATFLSRSVVITQYGIIPDVTRIRNAVPWGQIVDYFETTTPQGRRYVFFHMDEHGQRHRLELRVPCARVAAFQDIVDAKLDARFAFSMQRAGDKKTLEE